MAGSWRAGEGLDARRDVVRLISKAMVAPATPTPRHTHFLSCFDIFWKTNHYNQRVLFYQGTALSGQGADGQAAGAVLVERLKSSLALCLVHYYPWCGRLSRPAGHRLSIDCNDAGVEFVEASLPHLPISLLSSQAFQSQPFFEHLCPKADHSGDCLYSSPLLAIQATLFSDGGLALGITQSHVVADGQSLWSFMVSWGECARGLPLSAPPDLDRERLALPDPSPEKATWELNVKIKEEDTEDQEQEDVNLEKNYGEGVGALSSSEDNKEVARAATSPSDEGGSAGTQASLDADRVPCLFNLAASAVKNLKMQDGGVHTSYEVTCAHLWQRLTFARQRPSLEPTHIIVLANCRSRVKPPLSPAYFGNVIAFGTAIDTSGKICSESLYATASRIHDALVETIDSLEGLMHWLEIHDHNIIEEVNLKMPKGKGIIVASSPWFPVYEVDFGWGKPMAVRSPKVPGDGELVFFGGNPKATSRDVEICTRLPRDVLRRLLEDPLFLGQAPFNPFDFDDA